MTEGMLEWHTHEGFPENLEEVLPNGGNLTETTLSDWQNELDGIQSNFLKQIWITAFNKHQHSLFYKASVVVKC